MALKSPIALPLHFTGNRAQGHQKGEPVAQFELGPYRNFVYCILDCIQKQAAVIDCSSDWEPIESLLAETGLNLTALFLTHTHHDHVDGIEEVLETHPDCKIYLHEKDAHRLSSKNRAIQNALRFVKDQEILQFGSLKLRAWHTPGHSAGALCYELNASGEKSGSQKYFFTGDTLFIGDCGRTDLETGSTPQMFQSLQKMKNWPADGIILPGHHYVEPCASTVAQELETNSALRCQSVEELEHLP